MLALIILCLSALSLAQFVSPPTFARVLTSPFNKNITVSYNPVGQDICRTVFPSQKQYAGYISLPPFTLTPIQQNYSINTFFWFVEARESPETAPLTIWLNGGPGSSSMIGFFEENGPCEVILAPNSSYITQPRMWGWDRSSNVLYVDQPAQVGFSYDSLRNASYDLLENVFVDPPTSNPPGRKPETFLNGTFSSGNQYATANTSQIAAHALWHFLQTFLGVFPQYNPGARPNGTVVSSTGVNIFAESYGGTYGPVLATLFTEKNQERSKGIIPANNSLEIKLSTLGIVNGLVDIATQMPYYLSFAGNNSYGIEAIKQLDRLNGLYNLTAPGGCKELVIKCRQSAVLDVAGNGDDADINSVCHDALVACTQIESLFDASGLNYYDIRQKNPTPFPPAAYQEYLSYSNVQMAIGVPLNYTEASTTVQNAFIATGDQVRADSLSDLATLLKSNVRVAFLYGDADYICNWHGGEAVSLAVAKKLASYGPFLQAGYAEIVVNSSYVGGEVRQYGNLSFARIYDSGHLVPAYQPETAFTLFTRIITGVDLSTGKQIDLNFSSSGPSNSTQTNSAPPSADPTCWIRAIGDTCTKDEIELLRNNKGVVHNGVFYEKEADYNPPTSSVSSSKSSAQKGSSSTSIPPTGVYVATGTPTATATHKSSAASNFNVLGLELSSALTSYYHHLVISGFLATIIVQL